MSFNIVGTGSCLASQVVTNSDLSKIMDTNDEWIRTRTGIESRHIITTESLSSLAINAANNALQASKIDAASIDLVICACLVGDNVTPSMACIVAEALHISAPAFDINAACTGLIYAFSIAESFMLTNKASNILVVTCEAMSRLVDWHDRSSAVLFGDGAGAVVLTRGDGLKCVNITCVPNSKLIYCPISMGNNPYFTGEKPTASLVMDGAEVYKFAVNTMVSEIEKALKSANLTIEDIDYVLPHQANMRIIDAAKKRFGVPKEKVLTNIATCGNMSATSIAVLLDEFARSGKFNAGDKLLLVAFGAGMTAGAAIIQWGCGGGTAAVRRLCDGALPM